MYTELFIRGVGDMNTLMQNAMFVIFLINLSYAQIDVSNVLQDGDDNSCTIEQQFNSISSDTGNEINIEQVGRINISTIIQLNNSSGNNIGNIQQFGNMNETIISQTGMDNHAFVNHTGEDNFSLIEQQGENNIVEINLNGMRNQYQVFQLGNQNLVRDNLNGDEFDYTIRQNGNNNVFTRIDRGDPPKQYQITQNGDGIEIIIIDGPVP